MCATSPRRITSPVCVTRFSHYRALFRGASSRVRPKAMTVSVILAGLIPVMIGDGIGNDVMKRIAAPLVGGMLTAPLLSLLLVPVLYHRWQRRRAVRGSMS
jgi:Cu(I)/Ag(I) efflux system membrane protein CusA/SilA